MKHTINAAPRSHYRSKPNATPETDARAALPDFQPAVIYEPVSDWTDAANVSEAGDNESKPMLPMLQVEKLQRAELLLAAHGFIHLQCTCCLGKDFSLIAFTSTLLLKSNIVYLFIAYTCACLLGH